MTNPLLRSHVGGSSARGLAHTGAGRGEFRDTEIGQQQVWQLWVRLVAAHQKVRGFDILVNDLVTVRVSQGGGGLPDKARYILWRERLLLPTLAQPCRERAFLAIGHHHKGEGSRFHLLLAIVEEGQNIGMVERGNGSHFTLKKARSLLCRLAIRIGCRLGPRHFDGYLAAYMCIFSKIYFSHAAASEKSEQAVASKLHSFE